MSSCNFLKVFLLSFFCIFLLSKSSFKYFKSSFKILFNFMCKLKFCKQTLQEIRSYTEAQICRNIIWIVHLRGVSEKSWYVGVWASETIKRREIVGNDREIHILGKSSLCVIGISRCSSDDIINLIKKQIQKILKIINKIEI